MSIVYYKIFIKKDKKVDVFFFCPLRWLRGGVSELRGHVPYKVEFFFTPSSIHTSYAQCIKNNVAPPSKSKNIRK